MDIQSLYPRRAARWFHLLNPLVSEIAGLYNTESNLIISPLEEINALLPQMPI